MSLRLHWSFIMVNRMRVFALSLSILVGIAIPAIAAPGDQWILGIHHFSQGTGTFTENVGAGYGGPVSSGASQYFANSYAHSGGAGDISRIFWELSGSALNGSIPGDHNHDNVVNAADYVAWRKTEIDGQNGYDTWQDNFGKTGNSPPTTTELYTIEYWGVAQPGNRNDYQVIESQFHGAGGEEFSFDSHIPWAGQFGTNHQWIKQNDSHANGEWLAAGPFGPQAPDSNDFNASGFGPYMWLTAGSWLYVKWDQPFSANRAWSALRLTQVTENGQFVQGNSALGGGAVPEPAGVTLLVVGLLGATWLGSRRFRETEHRAVRRDRE
jgi:hypothetical protein